MFLRTQLSASLRKSVGKSEGLEKARVQRSRGTLALSLPGATAGFVAKWDLARADCRHRGARFPPPSGAGKLTCWQLIVWGKASLL